MQVFSYLDYHPRPGKNAGAWCGRFRSQTYEDGKKIYPVVTMVTNFTRPSGDTPALLSWDETQTLFHEFGHALAGLFTDGNMTGQPAAFHGIWLNCHHR